MPDLVLIPRSGLESALAPDRYGAEATPGVTITPRSGLALASVIARAGKTDELTRRVGQLFGLTLPATPHRVAAGTIGFAWAGPGQWLATSEQVEGRVFEATLRRDLAGLAAVIDQSDGRAVFRVGGPKARDAFAKGIPLDLDRSVFRPGDTALTSAGHFNVHLWQVDETPAYEVAVFRSFARSFGDWLMEAAAEFGVSVTAPD